MNEDHVDLTVLFVKCTVDAVPLAWLVVVVAVLCEDLVWSLDVLRTEENSLVVRHVVTSWNLLDEVAMVVPCTCVIVVITDLVDLSSCRHALEP